MITNTFIDNAKVMSKGQVTIPKDVRKILGISSGDRITFVVENGNVRLINSAVYAMQLLQAQMANEAENTGLTSDEAVMDLVKEVRKKDFTYIIETRSGPKPNPLIKMMDEARRDMAESSRRLGMTLDWQLKAAHVKASKEEEELKRVFGDF